MDYDKIIKLAIEAKNIELAIFTFRATILGNSSFPKDVQMALYDDLNYLESKESSIESKLKKEALVNEPDISAVKDITVALQEICELFENIGDYIAVEGGFIVGKKAFEINGRFPPYDKAKKALKAAGL